MAADVQIYQCTHQELQARVERVDVLIADPPFSDRVHLGQKVKRHDGARGVTLDGLDFAQWSESQACAFVAGWSPRVTRWMAILCSHDQLPVYELAFKAASRYVFAPIPCVIRGMTCRMAGDGPSSWTIWLLVARPVGMRPLSGTLPGAYIGPREKLLLPGSKPLWLMSELVTDYTRPGDVVCDPCAGTGTTVVAAMRAGRTAIGGEPDASRFAVLQGRVFAERDAQCEPLTQA
jgi:site-specific DNA-methyltransferase (adenine-specific)